MTGGVFLSIFWQYTTYPGFALPLYLLFFICGGCAALSNITHFTFVSRYEAANTTALAVGMASGSMSAGLLALLQGTVLESSGFSVSIYYAVLTATFPLAVFALHYGIPDMLHNISITDSYSHHTESKEYDDVTTKSLLPPPQCSKYCNEDNNSTPSATISKSFHISKQLQDELLFARMHRTLLSLQFFNAFLAYGIVPSLISFACGRFAHRNKVLLYATGFYCVMDPLAKSFTLFFRATQLKHFLFITAILCTLSSFLVLCATLPYDSSNGDMKWLYEGYGGGATVVTAYVCIGGLFGYSNTCVFRYFKEEMQIDDGLSVEEQAGEVQRAYKLAGLATQSGAFLGSVITFFLVVTNSLG